MRPRTVLVDRGDTVIGEDADALSRHAIFLVDVQLLRLSQAIQDLRPHLLEEIKEFFVDYNKLRDREFKPRETPGPAKAKKLVKMGIKAFARNR